MRKEMKPDIKRKVKQNRKACFNSKNFCCEKKELMDLKRKLYDERMTPLLQRRGQRSRNVNAVSNDGNTNKNNYNGGMLVCKFAYTLLKWSVYVRGV